MALKLMADNGIYIYAQDDGNHYYGLGNYQKHYVNKYVVQEMNMTHTGLLATLLTGSASVYGRHIINDSDVRLVMPANFTGYLALRVDLTQIAGNEVSLIATPILQTQDLANSGQVYDLPLRYIVTNSTQATTFNDLRVYKDEFYSKTQADNKFSTITAVNTVNSTLNNHIAGAPASHITSGIFDDLRIPHIEKSGTSVRLVTTEDKSYPRVEWQVKSDASASIVFRNSPTEASEWGGFTATKQGFASADATANFHLVRYGQVSPVIIRTTDLLLPNTQTINNIASYSAFRITIAAISVNTGQYSRITHTFDREELEAGQCIMHYNHQSITQEFFKAFVRINALVGGAGSLAFSTVEKGSVFSSVVCTRIVGLKM